MKAIAKVALLVSLFAPMTLLASGGINTYNDMQNVGQRTTATNILGNWHVSIIEIDGAFVRIPEQAEGVDVQISNNQISGIAGCNNFMSPYTSKANMITVSEGASTRKMCHPEEVMRFEDAFLRLLNGSFIIEKNFEGITLVRDNVKIYLVR